MSVRYIAIAAIACRIPTKKARVRTHKKGCHHPVISEMAEYCSTCGMPRWMPSMEWKIKFDDNRITLDGQLKIIIVPDDMYIYAAHSEVSNYNEPNKIDIDKVDIRYYRSRIKDVLLPLDLWDEEQFGVWAILDVSY